MGTVLKVLISVLASAVATLTTAFALVKLAVNHLRNIPTRAPFPGSEYHAPWWLGLLVPGAIVGSLVLSPLLFALCYRLLSRGANGMLDRPVE
jgi:hypothetical protein